MKGMIKLNLPDKDPLPINQLARAIDVHVSTIYRWGSPHGVRGQRLPLLRIGGRTYIQRFDLEAFLRALNNPSTSTTEDVPSRRAHDQASVEAELDAAGF